MELARRPNLLAFVFREAATPEAYPLSLHDALPILGIPQGPPRTRRAPRRCRAPRSGRGDRAQGPGAARPHSRHRLVRSEEHTSELQSHSDLVCRLLLEKKKNVRPTRAAAARRRTRRAEDGVSPPAQPLGFCFPGGRHPRGLPSFPTRRSSDLGDSPRATSNPASPPPMPRAAKWPRRPGSRTWCGTAPFASSTGKIGRAHV